eukprot:3586811-Amphidinium_carterae.1
MRDDTQPPLAKTGAVPWGAPLDRLFDVFILRHCSSAMLCCQTRDPTSRFEILRVNPVVIGTKS